MEMHGNCLLLTDMSFGVSGMLYICIALLDDTHVAGGGLHSLS